MRLSFAQAADALTQRMVEAAGINHESTVLDLGSGRGLACLQIAQFTGAACVGLDLTPGNVARSRELASQHPELNLMFVEGSFTSLPEVIASARFTHIFSAAAFVHAHPELPTIFANIQRLLASGGQLVVSDFVAGFGRVEASAETRLHWYDRTSVPCCLHSHARWTELAEASGLRLLRYEALDEHQQHGYLELAAAARAHGMFALADSYRWSAQAVRAGHVGMNLALFSARGGRLAGSQEVNNAAAASGGAAESTTVVGLAPELDTKGVGAIGSAAAAQHYYTVAGGSRGHYSRILGPDNIHTGYYPHLSSPSLVRLNLPQAADALTERMTRLGRVNSSSRVLDLGSGKGRSCRLLASLTGAACVGVDLTPANVERSKEAAPPGLRLRYFHGSMTALPVEALTEPEGAGEPALFTHVFAQLSLCYVPKEVAAVLAQARKVLAPGGLLVFADHTAGDGQFEGTAAPPPQSAGWYRRLHMGSPPRSHGAWRRLLHEEGFTIRFYENIDDHMATSYRDAAATASSLDLVSQDGVPVAEQYREQVWTLEEGHNGMFVAVVSP